MTETHGYCPKCREVVPAMPSGACAWCDTQTGAGDAKPLPVNRSHAGHPILMDQALIDEARDLYLNEGIGLLTVARRLHHRTAYATEKSFAMSLERQWRLRGWRLRDRTEASRAHNYRHGKAVRGGDHAAYRRWLKAQRRTPCTATNRRGEPCQLPATADDYCHMHHPDRAAERDQHLAAMRDRMGGLVKRTCAGVSETHRAGQPCNRRANAGSDYCAVHQHQDPAHQEAA